MNRYLPILLVALGLLLVSTSFAAAQTGAKIETTNGQVCLDASTTFSPQSEGGKIHRCWKQLGLGILVNGCKTHIALPETAVAIGERPAPCWLFQTNPVPYEGPSPPLDLPPPKA
jgi:hypothetical protein